MADSFRSKHAGRPGSLLAIRVDYPLTTSAFEALPATDAKSQRRAEVKKFTSGLRIGEKAAWNATTIDEAHPFPSHSPQRTLSEFQAVKMEYNYRANALPQVNKETIFVRKPNKMQIDESLFLSKKERERVVSRCPGTNATLSRYEMQNAEGRSLESGWNTSILPPDDRTCPFKLPTYESFTETNKAKNLLEPTRYKTPQQRHNEVIGTMREAKLSARLPFGVSSASVLSTAQSTNLQLSAGGTFVASGAPAVFKMSNRNEWWDKCPVATPPSLAVDASQISKVETTILEASP